jgi:hypothetical protein
MEGPFQPPESREHSLNSLRPRRAASGRFPIKVSTGAQSDDASVPPVPRQHGASLRLPHSTSSRRPANPNGPGSERLRSNSESVLQATRAKRMGIIPRKTGDLATLDEQRSGKHGRGLSHGSYIEDKSGLLNGSLNKIISPLSPLDIERSREQYVSRLSSLPEQQQNAIQTDAIIEAARSVLYGLYQVHPHISNLVTVLRETIAQSSQLERVFYNASYHVDRLDNELQKWDARVDTTEAATLMSIEAVKNACMWSVSSYHHVGTLLLQNTTKIATVGDKRYLRTVMMLTYAGVIEIRNACRALPVFMDERLVNPMSATMPGTIRPTTGSRAPSSLARTRNGVSDYSSARSESLSSNAIGTPFSSESFAIPSTPSVVSLARMNSHGPDEGEDDQTFEKIFVGLRIATETATANLPGINDYFMQHVDHCKRTDNRAELSLWASLHQFCTLAIKECEDMKARLSTIKVKEPSSRGQRSFWELANAFVRVSNVILLGFASSNIFRDLSNWLFVSKTLKIQI